MSNWFKKLGLGLKRSSSHISTGISDIFIKRKVDSSTIEDLEDFLITCDLGIQSTTKIIKNFSSKKFDKEVSEIEIKQELAKDIIKILQPCEKELKISSNPHVILMVGVNGAGKTTTIGKLASKLKGKKISFIAGDTFRAAAVEQLNIWGKRNNIRVFSGTANCDSAGLCFEGLTEALKQKDDIIFIDTAGRLQNKSQLMEELKKVIRVIKKVIPEAPHSTLLVLDATTGQNALSQAKTFKSDVDVSGLVITKLDGSAKGGIIIAIAEETNLPIHYIGIGEGIDDLDIFNAEEYTKGLLEI